MTLKVTFVAAWQDLLTFFRAERTSSAVCFDLVLPALANHECFLSALARAVMAGELANVPARHLLVAEIVTLGYECST